MLKILPQYSENTRRKENSYANNCYFRNGFSSFDFVCSIGLCEREWGRMEPWRGWRQ
jgi:hypothetical protein